ncbi:MAG: uroporphyrinogen decarboxylase family protein, partial [Planctomycetota bacterium]
EPARFERLRDRITEVSLGMIDQWLTRDVDGIFFSDDWGTQRSLLIDPADWRRLYKPCYGRLFERVRAGGAHVWFHSCGDVRAIVADLVDLGLNVLHPVQPQAMDLAELSREFGGKLCFYGGIDSQGVLITGSPADVREEVRRVVETLGRPDGGYVGAPSQTVMPETPLDNVIAALETLAEYQ